MDDADDALVALWLTGVIVVFIGPPVGPEIASVVLLFEVFTCCCFGAVIFAVVGFVLVVCCVGDGDEDDVAAEAARCTPVILTLENEFASGLLVHSYLAVILFSPGLIVVYFDVSTKFHFE